MGAANGREDGWLVIVNPAAGGGRGGRRATAAIERLRAGGLRLTVRETEAPGGAVELARQGFAEGWRGFVAGGGDGTAFEVLNGLMPAALASGEKVRLGFLPLGTGNAYLRDFARDVAEHSIESLLAGRRRASDVLVLRHSAGEHYFLNLFGYGFPAEVTARTSGGLKRWGVAGYTLGVVLSLARLRPRPLPMRVDGGALDAEPLTFACVCNSRYTADMLIAPDAEIADGRADLIRVAPMGRLEVLRAFPRIFRGTHTELEAVTVTQAREIDFEPRGETEVMIDGEVLRLEPRGVRVLPRAIEVWV